MLGNTADKIGHWMRRQPWLMPVTIGEAAVLALGLLLLAGFVNVPEIGDRPLPDLRSLDPQLRKQEFFDVLRPAVSAVNEAVADRRARLNRIAAEVDGGEPVSWLDQRWLRRMAERYDIESKEAQPEALVTELHKHIDIVPVSLVLAQAAKESGWGTSRFARQGNNLFGMRCFEPGCGIVPAQRPAGRSFEVNTFDSVRHSVESYVLNLNRHFSYATFRDLRAALRSAGESLDGIALAEGLSDYSERGRAYVQDIQSLIIQNGLEDSSTGG